MGTNCSRPTEQARVFSLPSKKELIGKKNEKKTSGTSKASTGTVSITDVKKDDDNHSETASNVLIEMQENVNVDALQYLFDSIRDHHRHSASAFDLVASNTYVSEDIKRVMGTTLMNSYCIGLPGKRFYGGCSDIDKVERVTRELACDVFGAQFCEVQFLSGMLANIAAYHAILPHHGCTVMASPVKNGGHYSHNTGGALSQLFGANVVRTPWTREIYNVNVRSLDEAMSVHKPVLLILGWSEMLFEHDLPAIRKICDRHKCKIMYDMSHVAGLVAGGVFQRDMMAYADIVTSSTGKSLHSADHGLVLYNDPALTPKIREAVMPLLTSNTHFHETAALAVALLEMREFGAAYAKQVVANTKALGDEMTKRRFNVLCSSLGYSNSHELIISLKVNGSLLMNGQEATSTLSRAGIFANPQELPEDTTTTGATGLRLGTQVITRRGFKEGDMASVADAIEAAIIKEKDLDQVAEAVAFKCASFDKAAFSFQ